MYKVSLYNLTEDVRSAQPLLGSTELGSLNTEQLFKTLEQFRLLDPVENNNASPQIDISSPAGRLNITTTTGKLLAVDPADPSRTVHELTALQIIERLDMALPGPVVAGDSLAIHGPRQKGSRRRIFNQAIAFAMLVVGLLLNGYTLYSAFFTESVNKAPPLVLLTDRKDIQNQVEILAGTYVTGTDAGDRGIVIGNGGSLQLQEFAARGNVRKQTVRPFSLGRRNEKLYLAIKPKGQIEVANRDLLLLYGDSYRRMK